MPSKHDDILLLAHPIAQELLHCLVPVRLYASKMIMRPEREAKEHLDPCPEQTDSRYAEGPLREPEPALENAAPHPRAAAQTYYGDDYASRPVARQSPCHSMRLASGS
jgi:hypothetical protein